MKNEIINGIKDRNTKIAIIGLGYTGLPTAAVFASSGFHVIGVDANSEVIKAVLKGECRNNEPGVGKLIKEVVERGFLKATENTVSAVEFSDAVIVCVPTPISEDKKPNLCFLESACKNVSKGLSRGKLVVIQSTVPPGTIRDLVAPQLEHLSALKAGLDFWLAYAPERIAPGKALREFIKNARLIGGYDHLSAELAAELFRAVVKGPVIVTDIATAEVAKLAENTFRDVNLAFANELALLCEETGVDVLEAIKLANTHPRVNIHIPGPGVGGPCLPKDPYFLLHSSKPTDYDIIKTARQINDYMPKHIVKLILQALKSKGKDIRNSRIAILGTAYKSNLDDSRLSPSEPIIHELIDLGAEATVYDPHCNESFGAKKAISLHDAIKGADCLAIITDHPEFKNLNLQEIKTSMNDKPAIVDGRRIVNPHEAEKLGFIYFGVGFGKPRNE